MTTPRTLSRKLAAALALALAAALLAVPSALAGAAKQPRAHAAASYLTGVGDEETTMFQSPLWQQLHTKIARYIAPWDAAIRPDELGRARAWIHEAEAAHQQILVAFYHSEHTATKMPSISAYQKAVAKFVKDFPHVRQYQSWNESNRGNVKGSFSSPSAGAAARYYQALKRVCKGCTVIGLDVLDEFSINATLRYIAAFKQEVRHLRTVMPSIWGLHNYSDLNRMQSWRTREIARALGGQVWLTETGGLVQFKPSFLNKNGSGLTRAARVLKYMFAVAGSNSRIKRLYIYNWIGGNSRTRFDAGLMNAHDQPRPGYVVVCKQLHAANCSVKTVRN
jgi:Glycosyl hydrolase catalytic core